ncbi:MAG: hypothetical protein N2234_02555 [Planctomycetota bacterium]|nr:hypothetical protein [Planctomycetota bacterium]
MAYVKEVIFQNIGKAIKKCNKIAGDEGFKSLLDSIMEEIVELYNDSSEEREILYRFSSANRADLQALDGMVSRTVAVVTAYLTSSVRKDLEVVGSGAKDVLEALAEAMEEEGDTVKQNSIELEGPTGSPENAGNGICEILEVTQNALDENHFEIVCVDASVEGSEQWAVRSSRLGELGMAVTGEEFESKSGGVRILITAQDEIEEIGGDEKNQLSGWEFAGAEKGENTEEEGRLYVRLSDNSGTRTVSCYKDAAKTALVCEGSRSGNGTLTLRETNDSGLTGSVVVSYVEDDSDIVLKLPFAFGVGDRFRFSTNISDKGLFQSFFVEKFGTALPSAQSGSETVPEAWAM